MSIYCTYITFYRGNKLPPFYIGKSSVEKVNKGYRGSVASKEYKNIWKKELKENPLLFKTIILKTFITKEESSIHETYLQTYFNVHKNSMYINMAIGNISYNLDKQLQNKTHHFNDSILQKELNMRQIREGRHIFQDIEAQKRNSQKQKEKPYFHNNQSKTATKMNNDRVLKGIHHWQGQLGSDNMKNFIKNSTTRANSIRLKELKEKYNLKLDHMYDRKSDDWINSKIDEIEHYIDLGMNVESIYNTNCFVNLVTAKNINTDVCLKITKEEFNLNFGILYVGGTAKRRCYVDLENNEYFLYKSQPIIKERNLILK